MNFTPSGSSLMLCMVSSNFSRAAGNTFKLLTVTFQILSEFERFDLFWSRALCRINQTQVLNPLLHSLFSLC
jgi:hypothetical protein